LIEIICGTFFICVAPWESASFESLSDEQAKEYNAMFKAPEFFLKTANGIAVIK